MEPLIITPEEASAVMEEYIKDTQATCTHVVDNTHTNAVHKSVVMA